MTKGKKTHLQFQRESIGRNPSKEFLQVEGKTLFALEEFENIVMHLFNRILGIAKILHDVAMMQFIETWCDIQFPVLRWWVI